MGGGHDTPQTALQKRGAVHTYELGWSRERKFLTAAVGGGEEGAAAAAVLCGRLAGY